MNAKGSFAAAATASRILAGGFILLAALATAPARAADTVTLTAAYSISIHGVTIGRAEAKARFTRKGYAAAISGSTYGISRIVSDARAILAGSGRINGTNVSPPRTIWKPASAASRRTCAWPCAAARSSTSTPFRA
jgi:hypothetical protein